MLKENGKNSRSQLEAAVGFKKKINKPWLQHETTKGLVEERKSAKRETFETNGEQSKDKYKVLDEKVKQSAKMVWKWSNITRGGRKWKEYSRRQNNLLQKRSLQPSYNKILSLNFYFN